MIGLRESRVSSQAMELGAQAFLGGGRAGMDMGTKGFSEAGHSFRPIMERASQAQHHPLKRRAHGGTIIIPVTVQYPRPETCQPCTMDFLNSRSWFEQTLMVKST